MCSSTTILGSNCCGCNESSKNFVKFNCNQLTNGLNDFFVDLSNVSIDYTALDRRNLSLNEKNVDLDIHSVDSDYIIYKSTLPVSLYDDDKNVTNINLLCSIEEINEDGFYVDIKYSIKKIISSNYGFDGENVLLNMIDMITRMWNPEFGDIPIATPDRKYQHSVGAIEEFYLIKDKVHRVLKDPNENFDLYSYYWVEEFVYGNIKYNFKLNVQEPEIVPEEYFSSFDEDGSVISSSQDIEYTQYWLRLGEVSVNNSKSTYEAIYLKHSPANLITVRGNNNDTVNSYYTVLLFGHNNKIGIGSFGMIPLSQRINLVNENDEKLSLDVLSLTA